MKEKGIEGRFYGRNMVQFYLGPADFEPADDTLPPTRDIDGLLNIKTESILSCLMLHLLQRGVACQRSNLWVMSSAHTKEDIDLTIKVLADSFDALIDECIPKPSA